MKCLEQELAVKKLKGELRDVFFLPSVLAIF